MRAAGADPGRLRHHAAAGAIAAAGVSVLEFMIGSPMLDPRSGPDRPLIAVNADVGPRSGREHLFVYTAYVDWIEAAGGVPVVLPPCESSLENLGRFDGVVLVGGDDYRALSEEPESVPNFTPIEPRRERFDLRLAERILESKVPVLAVCAGAQLLGVLGGGEIWDDLPDAPGLHARHRRLRSDDPLPRHDVEWDAPARLGIDPESGRFAIPSQHHQALRRVGDGWTVVARCPDDDVVEAACGPGPFQLLVQWHPELDPDSPLSTATMRAFIRAADVRCGARA